MSQNSASKGQENQLGIKSGTLTYNLLGNWSTL